MAKEMDKKMESIEVKVENPVVTLVGNLVKVTQIIFKVELNSDNKTKIEDGLKLAINKYMKDAEDAKKKLMMESMGGMSGMMDMLKSLK